MRKHYLNGDEITLIHAGCDSCNPSMINGTLVHESGCSDSWRDYVRECKWCGNNFYPIDREQFFCNQDCWECYNY